METTTRPGTPLRHRMLDDMRMRKFAEHTQDGYIRAVRKLAAFLGRSPDTVARGRCGWRASCCHCAPATWSSSRPGPTTRTRSSTPATRRCATCRSAPRSGRRCASTPTLASSACPGAGCTGLRMPWTTGTASPELHAPGWARAAPGGPVLRVVVVPETCRLWGLSHRTATQGNTSGWCALPGLIPGAATPSGRSLQAVLCSVRPRSSMLCCRIRYFWILPVMVIGKPSTKRM